MNDSNEITVLKEFQSIKPFLDDWGRFVDSELISFLESKHYSAERVQQLPVHRIKTDKSYIEKALYRNKNYKNPILEITDKVGTRVVLLNIEDVDVVSGFIEGYKSWRVIENARDYEKIREEKPEEFHYQSNHFIVKPLPSRYDAALCDLLTCEIQVRTLLQHAYAETSHDTVYKKGQNHSPIILRSLAVTMAFLETADEKIKLIYEKSGSTSSPKSDLIEILAGKYKQYVPTYDDRTYNPAMTDSVVDLFDDAFLGEACVELPSYIQSIDKDIKHSLNEPTLSLFEQPIVLFVFYALKKKQSFMIEKWPFTRESLEQVLYAMNTSVDVLY